MNGLPFACETVTLVRKLAANGTSTYELHVLSGCSWQPKRSLEIDGVVIAVSDATVCRIPADCGIVPKTGDLLCLGECAAPASAHEFAAMTQREQAFLVRTIHDGSRSAILPHYYCAG